MKYILLLFCLLFFAFFASAQEAEYTDPAETNDVEEDANGDEEPAVTTGITFSYIEMDIRTSSLMELAAWSRQLGLNDGGTRDDLAARLRAHYGLPAQGAARPAQRVIIIESANTTEYFTITTVNEEYARLRGDVVISLRDGASTHRIEAWEVLYNRTRNVMTATGNVVYTRVEGNTVETFRGQSITVNLDNWSSIFMDGVSERAVLGRGAAYRFAGTIISRTDEDVTVLRRATITNAATEEAFWSITASRLWLLPGNDWAIANAVLRVGHIPLFYIPFFFFPADEIVFHPVLGSRTREGTFLQTTTYILGRPRASSVTENSITSIFGGAGDMDRTREGIFLRTTGERVFDPRNIQLSLLFDIYTNLGFYLGTELSLPARGMFGPTTVSAGIGLTRDIFSVGGRFTPFRDNDGTSEWNTGRFLFMDLPVRFRINASGSFRLNHGTWNWEFPFYSDPFVDRDFMRRQPTMDWLTMIREWGDDEMVADGALGTQVWRLRGNFNPPIRNLSPFVTAFSVPEISTSLQFNQRNSASYTGPAFPANPGRAFFFPNQFTLLNIRATVAGTPLTTGVTTIERERPLVGPAPGDKLLPDLPIPPWETVEILDEEVRDPFEMYTFAPPILAQRFAFPTRGGPQFSIGYRLNPTAATQMQFRSSRWRDPEDINWGDVASIFASLRTDGSIDLNVRHIGGGAYTGTFRISAVGSYQNYLFINDQAEEFAGGGVQAARNRAHTGTSLSSDWNLSTTVTPFFRNPVWRATNFTYTLGGLLGRTTVDTSGPNPSWSWDFGNWDRTDIRAHTFAANFAANVRENNQTFAISAILPPRDSSVSGNFTLRAGDAGFSETSATGRILFPFDEEQRRIDPVTFTQAFRFNPRTNFRQHIAFDPEENGFTTLTSDFSFGNFTSAFSARFIQPYRFNHMGSVDPSQPDGWIQMPDRGLHPHELRFAYRTTFARTNLWENRMNVSVSMTSDLRFDLQQYTRTNLTFGLDARVTIANFLDLRVSTRSENAVMFKYFQNLPFFNVPTDLYPGMEQNILRDLLNSFRFDNDALRRQSGFNLRSLNLSIVHHLGDWDASLTMNMTPFRPHDSRTFRFNNEISFLVQWVPIPELSTRIDRQQDRLIVR